MISDLANFDILDLSLGEKWTDQEKDEFLDQFEKALGGYMGKELTTYFDEAANKEFEELIKKEGVTEEEITAFYKTKIPNMDQTVTDIVLAFKKKFLLKLYEENKKTFADKNTTNDQNPWEKVLEVANTDDWNSVTQTLQAIPH